MSVNAHRESLPRASLRADIRRYDVGLVWKRGQKWKRLVMFNRSGRADRCAEETAAALGLPLVAPPSYLKSSRDIRNGLG